MDPVIDLAPGTEGNPLARWFAERIRRNVLAHRGCRRALDRLRGSVAVIADDAGLALTLRFDYGRLVIHTGVIGVPDVTIRGDSATIRLLEELPVLSFAELPQGILGLAATVRAPVSLLRGATASVGGALWRRELKVYGLPLHPRTVLRFLRLVGRPWGKPQQGAAGCRG